MTYSIKRFCTVRVYHINTPTTIQAGSPFIHGIKRSCWSGFTVLKSMLAWWHDVMPVTQYFCKQIHCQSFSCSFTVITVFRAISQKLLSWKSLSIMTNPFLVLSFPQTTGFQRLHCLQPVLCTNTTDTTNTYFHKHKMVSTNLDTFCYSSKGQMGEAVVCDVMGS